MNHIDLLIEFRHSATEKHYAEFFGDEVASEWMSYFERDITGSIAYLYMDRSTRDRFVTYLTNRWALASQPEFCTEYPMSDYAIYCDTSEAETEVIL